jgi:hypothetical protein
MRPRVSRGKLAGVPASKKHLFDSVGPKSEHLKLFSLLGFGDFSKFLEWCLPGGQLTPTPCKSILLAVKPSQVPYNANIYIYIFVCCFGDGVKEGTSKKGALRLTIITRGGCSEPVSRARGGDGSLDVTTKFYKTH